MTDTLSDVLARAADGPADRGIVYLHADGSEHRQSYRDLRTDAQRIAAGLAVAGVRPGDPVLVPLSSLEDYLPAFWACVVGGFVAVPVAAPGEPGLAADRVRNVFQMCDRPVVVGSLPWPDVRSLTVGELRASSGVFVEPVVRPEDVFVILFTSGSTGVPKGVPLTHHNVLSMLRAYTREQGLTADETSFNWMPLEHVGGLVAFHVRDVYLGCAQVHTEPDTVLREPLRWLDWLTHYRATCTWGPNFAYGLVNDALAHGEARAWDLSPLRHILNAGEAIVPRTIQRFLALLAPHGLLSTAMCPSWGMSETSGGVTFATFSPADASGVRFIDVGPAIPGASIRVVDELGRTLPEGRAGSIQVTGPTVIRSYYRNPALDARAFTVDGWFDTGDVGVLRAGRLTITGRVKDIIIVNGLNYYCQEIEAVVEEVPGVDASYTGAFGVRADGDDTEALAIVYHTKLTEPGAVAEQCHQIRQRVATAVGLNPAVLLPLERAAIPKTDTGKIARNRLRERFAAGDFDEVLARVRAMAGVVKEVDTESAAPTSAVERTLVEIWQRALGLDSVGPHDDFYDLGGDSLVNMRIVALARKAGLTVTQSQIAEHRTIAALTMVVTHER